MLELYFAPETCALASHIALEETGLPYALRLVDFGHDEQQSEHYLRVNPKGRVPALVTGEGTITETPAMLVFIAQMAPASGLVQFDDPFEFAKLQAFNAYVCSTLHVAHAHRMRGYRWADEPEAIAAMQRKIPESVAVSYEYIEAHGFIGPYVMGDHYTVADPYLFTVARWMEADGVDLASFPRIVAHRAMMYERPAVRRALAMEMSSRS